MAVGATAQAKAFPPNVDPWSPGLMCCIMSSLHITAEMGINPPDKDFPIATISGLILL